MIYRQVFIFWFRREGEREPYSVRIKADDKNAAYAKAEAMVVRDRDIEEMWMDGE